MHAEKTVVHRAKSLAPLVGLTVCLIVGLALFSTRGFADEQYAGYDSIVHDLDGESTTAQVPQSSDPFDDIQFHAAFGAVMSHLNLVSTRGLPSSADLQGYEVDLGIDLFSPDWQAVGTLTSFNPFNSQQMELQMQEFGLLVQHEIPIQHMLSAIFAAGLTARYLTLTGNVPSTFAGENTTPASIFDGGLNFGITSGFGIRLDAAYEAPMIHTTADAGSIDGTLMLAGSF